MTTLRDIMNLDLFRNCPIRAGSDGLDKPITGATVMEVPDVFPWLRSGDMVLTTLYAIHTDTQALANLVPQLVQRGCVALAIKTKRYLEDIPSIFLEQANRLQFPIIQLAPSISHSIALETILGRIVNEKMTIVDEATRHWKHLISITLSRPDSSLSMILDAISKIVLDNPIILLRENTVIATSKSDTFLNTILVNPKFFHFVSWNIWGQSQFGSQILTASITYNNNSYRVFRCDTEVDNSPLIMILFDLNNSCPVSQVMACEYFLDVCALEFAKQKSTQAIAKRYKTSFLYELLNNDHKKQDNKLLIDRAREFGWILSDGPCTAILIRLNRETATFNTHILINNMITAIDNRGIVSNLNDQILLILPSHNANGSDSIENELQTLFLSCRIEKDNIQCGIGRPALLNELSRSYKESTLVVNFLSWARISGIWNYTRLGIYRLLLAISETSNLDEYIAEWLEPLLSYDAHSQTQLTATLAAYFNNGGNMRRTAQNLFVHYNTVVYRLKQIESILQGSFQDSQWSLNVHLATKAWEVTQWGIHKSESPTLKPIT